MLQQYRAESRVSVSARLLMFKSKYVGHTPTASTTKRWYICHLIQYESVRPTANCNTHVFGSRFTSIERS